MEDKYMLFTHNGYFDRKDVIDKLVDNELDSIHIGTYTEEVGEDLSYHGSSYFETITKIRELDSGNVYTHVSGDYYDKHADTVAFIRADRLVSVMEALEMEPAVVTMPV